MQLLNDKNIYEQISQQTINKNIDVFNNSYKFNPRRGQILVIINWLLPIIPTIHNLPKTYKPGIPLRLNFSGTGSVSHHIIAKSLAKMFFPHVSTTNNLPIKNFGDLLNKINDLYMEKISSQPWYKIITNKYSR